MSMTGITSQADYRAECGLYRNNPWLEALPPILEGGSSIANFLRRPPPVEPSEETRGLPREERIRLALSVLEAYEPVNESIHLTRLLDRLLREGYRRRNPLEIGFSDSVARAANRVAEGTEGTVAPSSQTATGYVQRSLPSGLHIVGHSGVGKTSAVQGALSYYPQVIRHSEYQGHFFGSAQLVWLYRECPTQDSLGPLCMDLMQQADRMAGTDHKDFYLRTKTSAESLVRPAAILLGQLGVGALVIDEIQNLAPARSGGSGRILNFFVRLSNEANVPVIFVATPEGLEALTGELRQARRGATLGDIYWRPMDRDRAFREFLEGIWPYQYVRRPSQSPSEPELCAIHEISQGLAAIAVSLFVLAQMRAIENGEERLTPKLFEDVGRWEYELLGRSLEGLRHPDGTAAYEIRDIEAALRLAPARIEGVQAPAGQEPDARERVQDEGDPYAEADESGLLEALDEDPAYGAEEGTDGEEA